MNQFFKNTHFIEFHIVYFMEPLSIIIFQILGGRINVHFRKVVFLNIWWGRLLIWNVFLLRKPTPGYDRESLSAYRKEGNIFLSQWLLSEWVTAEKRSLTAKCMTFHKVRFVIDLFCSGWKRRTNRDTCVTATKNAWSPQHSLPGRSRHQTINSTLWSTYNDSPSVRRIWWKLYSL